MASFSTFALAEARAKVLMDGGNSATYSIVEAYAARNKAGTLGVRVLRLANVAAGSTAESVMSKPGAWDFLTDDTYT